ncbi:hypothetical protein LTR85_009793 [Meristemomyces frigidus]|nr:hypothetical protein LTR85_009793 [Meristemomyces frigidus]
MSPVAPNMTGFFDLPRELRDVIYEMVLRHDRPLALHPHFDDRETIAELYDTLRTSRAVYHEAMPIFWAVNDVSLCAEPSVFAPDAGDPYDLENLGSWLTRVGVKSVCTRGSIKRLIVDMYDPEVEEEEALIGGEWVSYRDWWRDDCGVNPSHGGPVSLENVTQLTLNMSAWSSENAGYPDVVDIETVTRLRDPDADPDYDPVDMIAQSRTIRRSTAVTLEYLLSHFHGLEHVVVRGAINPAQAGLTWFGQEINPLDPNGIFIRSLRLLAKDAGCEFRLAVDTSASYCWLCKDAWVEGHWSPKTPDGTCPSLHDQPHNLDGECRDDWWNKWERADMRD